jgi:Tol biopolymer transport system component
MKRNGLLTSALLACASVGSAAQSADAPVPLAPCNSAAADYAPAYDPLTQTLVFTSERDGVATIYRCSRGTTLDSTSVRAAGTFNADGKHRAFVTFTSDGEGVGVAYALYDDQSYPGIVTVPRDNADINIGHAVAAVNGPFFVSHPAISPDGSRLVFASTRPGGEGGLDLWSTERREDRTWSVPMNLGRAVNTSEDEITPWFASADTLLFATNGQGGLGGFDIFMTVYRNGSWQEPLPLDRLNSEFDDSDCIVLPDGSHVFASDRPGGAGALDIWIVRSK